MLSTPIQFVVNGRPLSLDVGSHHTLLDTLRDQIGLTGTKECCANGECGACTVLLNGRAVTSCLVLAAEADGTDIVTIEGLATDGHLDRLQQAFIDKGAVQCGFCIPGMVMAARYLLMTTPHPTDEEIKAGLEGNLCRCGGYSRIIEAVRAASENRSSAPEPPQAAREDTNEIRRKSAPEPPQAARENNNASRRKNAPGPQQAAREDNSARRRKSAPWPQQATREDNSARRRKSAPWPQQAAREDNSARRRKSAPWPQQAAREDK